MISPRVTVPPRQQFNPLHASKESVRKKKTKKTKQNKNDWRSGQHEQIDQRGYVQQGVKTRWFLLTVRSGPVRSRPAAVMGSLQELRWGLSAARTMHSREEPEPHWAIVGAERRSTCSPRHDVGARGMTVHGVHCRRRLKIWRQEIGIRFETLKKKKKKGEMHGIIVQNKYNTSEYNYLRRPNRFELYSCIDSTLWQIAIYHRDYYFQGALCCFG